SSGCYDTSTVTIAVHPVPVITVDTIPPGCPGMNNGSITLTVNDGTPPYVYWWNTGDSLSALSDLTNGTYSVTVSDARQCSASETIEFNILADCIDPVVYVPNVFSPNGDGINDVVFVHGKDIFIDWIIFDRWGEEVFESKDISIGWDGTFKGKKMPSDVYVYRLIVTWADGTEIRKKGNISLVR
ncbi:MAG TPA: gliding motility-associated C-terminal domain-containing protein, partial [Bacteroidales bacterium]|nr:gliding motility-associated C-terminal domain-containing protein [Bacteroidales bacterium]